MDFILQREKKYLFNKQKINQLVEMPTGYYYLEEETNELQDSKGRHPMGFG